MKTKEDLIREFEEWVAKLPKEDRDRIFFACACEENHEYSPSSMLAAIKDPSNQEGQEFLQASLDLQNETPT